MQILTVKMPQEFLKWAVEEMGFCLCVLKVADYWHCAEFLTNGEYFFQQLHVFFILFLNLKFHQWALPPCLPLPLTSSESKPGGGDGWTARALPTGRLAT